LFLVTSPLLKVFKKVSNPQKFFKKQFIAAAFAGVVGTYVAAGAILYSSAKEEWNKKDGFQITDLFSINAVRKHGKNGVAAVAISYVGDACLIYGLAGVGYHRSRKKKQNKQQSLENP